jgi:uncharacterized protein (TIGR00661 family)
LAVYYRFSTEGGDHESLGKQRDILGYGLPEQNFRPGWEKTGFDHPDEVQTLLAPFTTHHFFIYGITELKSPVDKGHLHLRPYSRSGFLQDLEDCNGVICGAGFELAGEALQLGKKLLVKPLKGQFEQLSNALALEKLQLARVMQRLDRKAVQLWLELPPNALAGYPRIRRS